MSDHVVFEMGKHLAVLPCDRLYGRNHMWCLLGSSSGHRFGFSAYALRLMQDVYFLDWSVDPGQAVALKQQIGHIETSKAVSDLFAPIAGVLERFNPDVLHDPSLINVDGYGRGWLFEMSGSTEGLMDAPSYRDFLAANWEQTQRILKGQMGE